MTLEIEYKIENADNSWNAHRTAWLCHYLVGERPEVFMNEKLLRLKFYTNIDPKPITKEAIKDLPATSFKINFTWDIDKMLANLKAKTGKRWLYYAYPTDENKVETAFYCLDSISPVEIEGFEEIFKWQKS